MKGVRTFLLATWAVLLLICPFIAKGQNVKSFPNGFHIGITGEGNIAQRMNIIPIGTGYVDPISDPIMGW